MQILVYGFQRSGTTLLRRLIQLHPDVKKMFHEQLLLTRMKYNNTLLQFYLHHHNINIDNDNWGEKIPYYNLAKTESPIYYCKKWLTMFKEQGKIIHIIRHPYDVALSVVKKYNNIDNINQPLKIYKNMLPKVLDVLDSNDHVLNIKYEDLLLTPDDTLYKIYDFCSLTPDINYKEIMFKNINEKYRNIDSSRSFVYKEKKIKTNINMRKTIDILNNIPGIKYDF